MLSFERFHKNCQAVLAAVSINWLRKVSVIMCEDSDFLIDFSLRGLIMWIS